MFETFHFIDKLTILVNLDIDSAIDFESAKLKSPICNTTLVSGVIIVFNSNANASAVSIFRLTKLYCYNEESSDKMFKN